MHTCTNTPLKLSVAQSQLKKKKKTSFIKKYFNKVGRPQNSHAYFHIFYGGGANENKKKIHPNENLDFSVSQWKPPDMIYPFDFENVESFSVYQNPYFFFFIIIPK